MKDHIYRKLSPDERAFASFESLVRNDIKEIRRLIETAPRVAISMTDPTYHEKMYDDTLAEMAHECEMRGEIIGFLLSKLYQEKVSTTFFQRMVICEIKWREYLKKRGKITPELLRACGLPRPSYMNPIFDMVDIFTGISQKTCHPSPAQAQ